MARLPAHLKPKKPAPQLVPASHMAAFGPLGPRIQRSIVSALINNPNNYPELPEGVQRKIFVRALDKATSEALKEKGYVAVDLMTLPRMTLQDNIAYLLARVQASEEGTVVFSIEEEKALQLEMRAYGMLDRRELTINLGQAAQDKTNVDQLLDWGKSRHTLGGNTTIVGQGTGPRTSSGGASEGPGDSRDLKGPRSPKGRPVEARAPQGRPPGKNEPRSGTYDASEFEQSARKDGLQ